MFNYNRRFLNKPAELLLPLTEATKGTGNKIEWTDDCEAAFNKAKTAIANAALLHHPVPGAQLRLITDASDVATGGVLEQLVGGHWQPLEFFSKKLNDAQRKYSTFDRELLALYLAVQHFRHSIEGRNVQAYTCLLYTSPSPRDKRQSRMPSSA